MYVIMGGTGHVGSATASELLRRGEAVAIITRDASRDDPWRTKGAEIIEADVNDVPSLRAAFQRGTRAFLLKPPADPSQDTDVVERRTVSHCDPDGRTSRPGPGSRRAIVIAGERCWYSLH